MSDTTTAHRITWWVYADGERIRRTSTMRGTWGFDATCSCGWDSKTGGGVESYVRREVEDHKYEADPEGYRARQQARHDKKMADITARVDAIMGRSS